MTANTLLPLVEAYRPRQWSDVVGQEKAVATIQRVLRRGIGGRSFWFSGQSGTGKTTLARILAAELADEHNVTELDATDLTPAKLKEIEYGMQSRGFDFSGGGRSGRAYIVNEAHGLRRDAVRQLLVLLERLPRHVVFVFTTTVEGQASFEDSQVDSSPLLSRCVQVALSRRGLAEPFAKRAREIAQTEGLDGKPVEAYVRLLQDCRNNFREALQRVESGAMLD